MDLQSSLRYGAHTHPGYERDHNEDTFILDESAGLAAVIDGIGGHRAGEVAAKIAAEVLLARLGSSASLRHTPPDEAIKAAIAAANNAILDAARGRPEREGMACVLSVALLRDSTVFIGHVGDSRVYRIHQRSIEKLTLDHSPVGEREDAGELTELEAMRHSRRNEVFRDVGNEPHKADDPDFIDLLEVPFERDAALVLCSDGLSDLVTRAQILDVVLKCAGDPDRASRALIQKALDAGGKDNVTVIVIEGPDFGLSEEEEVPTGRLSSIRRVSSSHETSSGSVEAGARGSGEHPLTSPSRRVATIASREGALLSHDEGRSWRWLALLELIMLLVMSAILWRRLEAPQPVTVPANSPPQGGQVLRVGPTQTYRTFREALEADVPHAVLVVDPGVYAESLVLDAPITIIGLGREEVIVAPPSSTESPIVTIEGTSDVSLLGIQVGRGGQGNGGGIALRQASAVLERVRVEGTTRFGVEVKNSDHVVLRDVVVLPAQGRELVCEGTPPVLVGSVPGALSPGACESKLEPPREGGAGIDPSSNRGTSSSGSATNQPRASSLQGASTHKPRATPPTATPAVRQRSSPSAGGGGPSSLSRVPTSESKAPSE